MVGVDQAARWVACRRGSPNTRRTRSLSSQTRQDRFWPTRWKPDRYRDAGSWLVEGIGEDFIPPLAHIDGVNRAWRITDRDAFATARELLKTEGILAGSSSGTLLAAALKYCQAQTTPKRVVTFACDSGNKYLSKMFNDDWMRQQG
ncbi:cystathionine beta-synthase [Enterobacter cloacae]|uniref:cysteine synthase n=1 Tax=Enterobacter cloacae TaxID=550 RepID=A0A377M2U2_ENTCL|nr:cystathionine beta-synthase [Enterobacter cloacae]